MAKRLFIGSCVDVLLSTIFSGMNQRDIVSWILSLPVKLEDITDTFANMPNKEINGSLCIYIDKGDASRYCNAVSNTEIPERYVRFFRGTDSEPDKPPKYSADKPYEVSDVYERKKIIDRRIYEILKKCNSMSQKKRLVDELMTIIKNDPMVGSKTRYYFSNLASKASDNTKIGKFLMEVLIHAVLVTKKELNRADNCHSNIGVLIPDLMYREKEFSLIAGYIKHGQKVISLSGEGGVGKAQIARHYAEKNKKSYDIIWEIKAETENDILTSYYEFLEYAGTCIEKKKATLSDISSGTGVSLLNPDDSSASSIIKLAFKNYFESTSLSWLLIYTNCLYDYDSREHGHTLNAYIPSCGNGHVILTTEQTTSYDNTADPIRVSVFSLEESIAYLAKQTSLEPDKYAKAIAETLGGLPLALEAAAAYIRNNDNQSYERYYKLLNENGLLVLDLGKLTTHRSPVSVTLMISLGNLLKTNQSETTRIALICVMLFCAVSPAGGFRLDLLDYTEKRFYKAVGEYLRNEVNRNYVIQQLKGYSIAITDGSGYLIIHPLMKQLIREMMAGEKGLFIDVKEYIKQSETDNLEERLLLDYWDAYTRFFFDRWNSDHANGGKHDDYMKRHYQNRAIYTQYMCEYLAFRERSKKHLFILESDEAYEKYAWLRYEYEFEHMISLIYVDLLSGNWTEMAEHISALEASYDYDNIPSDFLYRLLYLYNVVQKNTLRESAPCSIEVYQQKAVQFARKIIDIAQIEDWGSIHSQYRDFTDRVSPIAESIYILFQFDKSEDTICAVSKVFARVYRETNNILTTRLRSSNDKTLYYHLVSIKLALISVAKKVYKELPENERDLWVAGITKEIDGEDIIEDIQKCLDALGDEFGYLEIAPL